MTIEPKNQDGLAKVASDHGLTVEQAAEQLLDGAITMALERPKVRGLMAELEMGNDAIRRGKELVAAQRKIYARLREEYINLRAMNLAHETARDASSPALKG